MRLVESVKTVNSEDITYALVPVYLWAVAEVSSGLIVCCLPFIPRFFRPSPSESSKDESVRDTSNQHSHVSGRRVYHELDKIALQRSAATLGRTEIETSRNCSTDWEEQANPDVVPRYILDREGLEKDHHTLGCHTHTSPKP